MSGAIFSPQWVAVAYCLIIMVSAIFALFAHDKNRRSPIGRLFFRATDTFGQGELPYPLGPGRSSRYANFHRAQSPAVKAIFPGSHSIPTEIALNFDDASHLGRQYFEIIRMIAHRLRDAAVHKAISRD